MVGIPEPGEPDDRHDHRHHPERHLGRRTRAASCPLQLVREPILVALNILLHDPNIALEDAKARAAMRGAKITAASVNAAQRLLARQGEPGASTTPTGTAKATPKAAAIVRQARPPQPASNAEALIRDVVQKLEGQGNAEAERLRAAMRKAIAVLRAAVGS